MERCQFRRRPLRVLPLSMRPRRFVPDCGRGQPCPEAESLARGPRFLRRHAYFATLSPQTGGNVEQNGFPENVRMASRIYMLFASGFGTRHTWMQRRSSRMGRDVRHQEVLCWLALCESSHWERCSSVSPMGWRISQGSCPAKKRGLSSMKH